MMLSSALRETLRQQSCSMMARVWDSRSRPCAQAQALLQASQYLASMLQQMAQNASSVPDRYLQRY
jgi:hypothetical protein